MPQQTIPLTTFTLCDAEPGSGVDDVRRRPETDWLPATVPGGVHEALLAAGRIADPYFDRNEDGVRWVEERDWWFRTTVPADLVIAWWAHSVGLPGPGHGRRSLARRPATRPQREHVPPRHLRRHRSSGGSSGVAHLLPTAACRAHSACRCNQPAAAPRRCLGGRRSGGAGRRRRCWMMVGDVAAGHPAAQGDVLVGLGLRSAIAVDRTVATDRSGAAIGCSAERTPRTHRAGRRGPADCRPHRTGRGDPVAGRNATSG